MKRIKYLMFALLVGVMGIVSVNAASLNMTVSSRTVTVGSSVKVTVKANGADAWEYCLNYDSSILQLTSGNKCALGSILAGGETVTYTFKAIKQGTVTVNLSDVSMLDSAANELPVSKGNVKITVRSQSDISTETNTGSDNAYLKKLEVVGYSLNPTFDKKVYSYNLEVPNNVTEVGINAFREDNYSSISTNVKDIDHIVLSEGPNKIIITVKAQKGNKIEYVVNINRAAVDLVKVSVDDKEYSVLRNLKEVEKPRYFVEDSIELEEQKIPTYNNETIGYTLVALKDNEGNIALYNYNNGKFEKYYEVLNESLTLIPKNTEKRVSGYEQSKKIDINGNKIDVYYNNTNSDFVLIHAINVNNGETAWYSYDIKEGTIQRYVVKDVKEKSDSKDVYFYLAIGFVIIDVLCILIIFMLLGLNNRLREKNEKLIRKNKEKKVAVVEHPVFESDIEIESWKNFKYEDDSEYNDDEFFSREEDKINGEIEIKSDAFNTKETKIVKEKKRKSKRKTKEEKKKEEKELKAMRDDFLDNNIEELEETKKISSSGVIKKSSVKKK